MFNHKSDCYSDVSYNYFSGLLELRTGAYKKGDQVYISYGKQSNDRLLQYYGFVEENNPVDSYDFGIGILEMLLREGDALASAGLLPTDPSPAERIKKIAGILAKTPVQEPAVPGRRSLTIAADQSHVRYFRTSSQSAASQGSNESSGDTVTSSVTAILADASARRNALEDTLTEGTGTFILSKFDDVTVRTLRALLCTTQEWKAYESASDGFSLDALAVSLSDATEITIANTLRRLVRLELDSKPTSMAEDKALYNSMLSDRSSKRNYTDPSGSFSDPILAAVAFRIEKKMLLTEAISC